MPMLLPEKTVPTRTGHTKALLTSKVIGTPVFAVGGEKIGHVQDVMLDKCSDRLAFAVVDGDAFLASLKRYFPIPWALLDFQPARGGYVIELSEQQLRNAPAFDLDELTELDGVPARDRTEQFYNAI